MSRELKAQAAAELAELERAEGRLMRASIVAKAKDKASALHQYFEWDKTKAAQSHWLQTAGEIIRAYKVWVTVSGSEQPLQVRAFVSLSTDRVNGGGYRSWMTMTCAKRCWRTLSATWKYSSASTASCPS